MYLSHRHVTYLTELLVPLRYAMLLLLSSVGDLPGRLYDIQHFFFVSDEAELHLLPLLLRHDIGISRTRIIPITLYMLQLVGILANLPSIVTCGHPLLLQITQMIVKDGIISFNLSMTFIIF